MVHADAGGFFGGFTIAADQTITITGAGTVPTTGTQLMPSGAGDLITNYGTLTLKHVELADTHTTIHQEAGTLTADDVRFSSAFLALAMDGGSAHVSRSTFALEGTQDVDAVVTGGALSFTGTRFDDQLMQHGGTVTITGSEFDSRPHAVVVDGGGLVVGRSAFVSITDALHVSGTGTARVVASTFSDAEPAVTVAGGTATLIRDTLVSTPPTSAILVRQAGTLRLAATAVITTPGNGGTDCIGSVTDGGYNQASDTTCAFGAATSTNAATPLTVHPLAVDGAAPPDQAPTADSSLVDRIPPGAAALFNSGEGLCDSGTDQRGQVRPAAGSCDIGAVELAPTATTVTAPASATYGQWVTFTAHVTQPSGSVAPERLVGSVAFTSTDQTMPDSCGDVPVDTATGIATCRVQPYPGLHQVTATFVPTDAFHASAATAGVSVNRQTPSVTLTSSPTQPDARHAFTLTAMLRGTVGTVTGTVGFKHAGVYLSGCSSRALSNGVAACLVSRMPAGKQGIYLQYRGSSGYAPVTVLRYVTVTP